MASRVIEVRIGTDVYCSSSCTYFSNILLKRDTPERKKRFKQLELIDGALHINGVDSFPRRYEECPKYILRLILAEAEKVQDADWTFYEYDRDGNERRSDYRYHEPDHFLYLINSFKADLKKRLASRQNSASLPCG